MTTGHVFIAASLDGFIAREDHGLDWLMKQPQPAEGDGGFAAFMDRVDGLVMGAGTFRTVLGFGEWVYTKPVVVLSQSLSDDDIPADLKDKVRVSRATPAAIMDELAGEGWDRAYVDGGKLVQAFLRAGLIADLTITHIPILLGSGKPLFGPLKADLDLDLQSVEDFGNGMYQTCHRVISNTSG